NYPYAANEDNCDPPNAADKINPAQNDYTSHYISRGVTLKVPYPFGFTPHQAEAVDPLTGEVSQIVVIPAANAMGWEEGSGMFGTGSIDAMASSNNPNQPMLVLFAHDGDNHWAGGYSYYYESVPQFSHQAASAGYTPTVVAQYLQDHPVPADDIVHIEDGGWVNADGDFGSPQYINWNWPLVDPSGAFDIPSGWAEDERNWAVLTAAQNRVETAEQILGGVDPEKIVNPTGANNAERAWHHLLAGYESGYMYYGSSIDMEIKATLACNNAVTAADAVIAGGSDGTAPTIWLPQRLPWNPGGSGGGALWGYPGGAGAPMSSDFHIWTFAYDVSGLARIELMIREDLDGWNDPESHDNETFAGGAETGAWTALPMTYRDFPIGEPWDIPGIDFTVLPDYIADEYWLQLTGYAETLLDYYVEAEDNLGNIKRTPIQHVYVGEDASGGYVMDGSLDDGVALLASGGGLSLWGAREDNILYLATEGIGATADLDHFLMVLTDTSSVVNAPWAKSGSVREWDYFLAAEDGNGWIGWFDAAQSVQSGVSYGLAQGAVLEGTLNLDALYPGGIPETFWLAALGYETQDGGALIAQAPAGNGNGNVEGVEYCELAPASEVDDPAQQLFNGLSLSPHPTPFSSHLTLRLELPQAQNVQIDIFNIAGQRVAQIYDGPAATGSRDLSWNGRKSDGTACPNGIYWIKASGETGSVSARCVLMR
ncbi:MAG: T9SS type A sorting domain-containing protein, partial [Candidatus Eisenbacteria bacterium]|nr:T9SS type A sorting domain-containing protein [Candidatus Eisenbacteria bacterium]